MGFIDVVYTFTVDEGDASAGDSDIVPGSSASCDSHFTVPY